MICCSKIRYLKFMMITTIDKHKYTHAFYILPMRTSWNVPSKYRKQSLLVLFSSFDLFTLIRSKKPILFGFVSEPRKSWFIYVFYSRKVDFI